MKLFSVYLVALSTTISFSQVGIGTVNPQEYLHIAEPTGGIRIESLNATNNPLNNGVDLAPVFIDSNGAITLTNATTSSGPPYLNFLIDASDNLATTVVVTNPIGTARTDNNVYNQSFTMPQDGLIEVKYSLSFSLYATYNSATNTGTRIIDGQSRLINTYFTIDNDTSKIYGQVGQIYYNDSSDGGIGYFYNNGHNYLPLSAGVHTINLYVGIEGTTTNTAVAVVGGSFDLLKIRLFE